MNTSGLSAADILKEVQRKRNALRDEETEAFGKLANLDLIAGYARLLGPHTAEVTRVDGSKSVYRAKNIVLATGAKPLLIPVPGLPAARQLTNLSMFEQTDKPEHLAVVGSGVIGVEMAQAFAKLGSRVSMVSRADRVLGRLDPEASRVIGASLRSQIDLYLKAQTDGYDEATRTLSIKQNGALVPLTGVDKVLLAVGRVPVTQGLGLETVGVKVERSGVPIDGYGGTNVRGIYALGDVTQTSNFTHSANAQGRRLVQRLAFAFLPRLAKEPEYPSATFSDLEVATVGPSLAELQRRFHPDLIKTLRYDLTKTDKGYTQSLSRGFVQLHVVRLTGRILSATVVAPKASEMISLLTAHLYNGLPVYKLSNLIFPYPILSEGFKKAADGFVFATLPKLPEELGAYLKYRWAKPGSPKRIGERLEPVRG